MNDIREILEGLGYTLREFPQEFRTKPIYRESNNCTSLKINKENGDWVDFSANISGKFEELVKLTLNLPDASTAQKWLKDTHSFTPIPQGQKPQIIPNTIFENRYLDKLIPNHTYWLNRGVSESTIKCFQGGVVLQGKMANRYVFPVFGKEKKIYGFSGRAVNDIMVPKWKHIGNKSEWKYPLYFNHKIILDLGEIILIESIGDMLSLWDSGIKNTMVMFGLSISNPQLKSLLMLDPKRIVIAFNNDLDDSNNPGKVGAEMLMKKLMSYFDVDQVLIRLPEKKDFGEMSLNEIKTWYEGCKS